MNRSLSFTSLLNRSRFDPSIGLYLPNHFEIQLATPGRGPGLIIDPRADPLAGKLGLA